MILLLTALVAGGESVRADKVVILSEDFTEHQNETQLEAVGWDIEGYWAEAIFLSGNQGFQIGSGSGDCSATTPKLKSLEGRTAILTFKLRSTSSSGSARTLTISGHECLVDGQAETVRKTKAGKTVDVTVVITSASKESSISFSAKINEGCKIDDVVIYYYTFPVANACTDGTKYYGTFSCSSAFVVPNNITVSEITVSGGKLQVEDYVAGNIVPGNRGVMVSSTSYVTTSVEVTSKVGTPLLDNNMLKPSGDDGITSGTMNVENTQFYRLTMHNGIQIGFWWGAEDGAAFDLGANKAYLAVPSTAAARLQGLWLDETEGIIGMNREATDDKQPVYDLQGRQIVTRKSANGKLQRGLYIMNGRKVVR